MEADSGPSPLKPKRVGFQRDGGFHYSGEVLCYRTCCLKNAAGDRHQLGIVSR